MPYPHGRFALINFQLVCFMSFRVFSCESLSCAKCQGEAYMVGKWYSAWFPNLNSNLQPRGKQKLEHRPDGLAIHISLVPLFRIVLTILLWQLVQKEYFNCLVLNDFKLFFSLISVLTHCYHTSSLAVTQELRRFQRLTISSWLTCTMRSHGFVL